MAIENRTKAMKQLMEELFHYTIVVSETEELILEKTGINGVLESSISSYYAVLKEHDIVPQISIPDKKIEGMLNENALARIFVAFPECKAGNNIWFCSPYTKNKRAMEKLLMKRSPSIALLKERKNMKNNICKKSVFAFDGFIITVFCEHIVRNF